MKKLKCFLIISFIFITFIEYANLNICSAQEEKDYLPIRPILQYVKDNGDGTYTAQWGYYNPNSEVVEADESVIVYKGRVISSNEEFDTVRGPTITFFPMFMFDYYTTVFDGSPITWRITVAGNEAKELTASAADAEPVVTPTPKAPEPTPGPAADEETGNTDKGDLPYTGGVIESELIIGFLGTVMLLAGFILKGK